MLQAVGLRSVWGVSASVNLAERLLELTAQSIALSEQIGGNRLDLLQSSQQQLCSAFDMNCGGTTSVGLSHVFESHHCGHLESEAIFI
jgi:hypothetical protein